jgi:curli biogenesis system outer membrane secretion channel CsgG
MIDMPVFRRATLLVLGACLALWPGCRISTVDGDGEGPSPAMPSILHNLLGDDEPKTRPAAGPTASGTTATRPSPGPKTPSGPVSCDAFLIAVRDGSILDHAEGACGLSALDTLAKDLAEKFRGGMSEKGKTIAVLTFRNRSRSEKCAVVCEELADKITGALVETRHFAVKSRIDVKAILDEKSYQAAQLDSSKILDDPKIRAKIAGVDYVVIGGVTVTEASPSR